MAAMPKTLGGLEKRYVDLEEEVAGLKRSIKKLEAEQDEVLEAMQKLCAHQRIEAHRGARYTFTYGETEQAQITDWPALVRFAAKEEAFDLIQKRAAVVACRERWALNEMVPGVNRVAIREFKARALPGKAAS